MAEGRCGDGCYFLNVVERDRKSRAKINVTGIRWLQNRSCACADNDRMGLQQPCPGDPRDPFITCPDNGPAVARPDAGQKKDKRALEEVVIQ